MFEREETVKVYRQGVGVVLDDTARPLVLLTGEVVTVGGWPPEVEINLDMGDPEIAPLSFHAGEPAVVHGCVRVPAPLAQVRGCGRFLGERVALLVLPLLEGPPNRKLVARNPLPDQLEVSRLRALLARGAQLLQGARALADDTMRPELDGYLGDVHAALALAPSVVPSPEALGFLLVQVLDGAEPQDLEGIVWTVGQWSEDEQHAALTWGTWVYSSPKGSQINAVPPPHVQALAAELRIAREAAVHPDADLSDVDKILDNLGLAIDFGDSLDVFHSQAAYDAGRGVARVLVQGWDDDQRRSGVEWARAVHLSASDNPGVRVPVKPAHVAALEGHVVRAAKLSRYQPGPDVIAAAPTMPLAVAALVGLRNLGVLAASSEPYMEARAASGHTPAEPAPHTVFFRTMLDGQHVAWLARFRENPDAPGRGVEIVEVMRRNAAAPDDDGEVPPAPPVEG